MTYIKIGEKYFELASRKLRFSKFFARVLTYGAMGTITGIITFICVAILSICLGLIGIVVLLISAIVDFLFKTTWEKTLTNLEPILALVILGVSILIFVSVWASVREAFGGVIQRVAFDTHRAIRLADGKPCGFKENWIRRLTLLLQPFDIFWIFWKERQRLGDKLARTVVIKVDPDKTEDSAEINAAGTEASAVNIKDIIRHAYQSVSKNMFTFWRKNIWKERLTRILRETEIAETAIREMKNRLSVAEEKLESAILIEKQFRSLHENIISRAEQYYNGAADAVKKGDAERARKQLEKRNEYRRLATESKKRWADQEQVVLALRNLLAYIQQKMMEIEAKQAGVKAQYRKIATAADLRETLQHLRNNPLLQMEQDASAKAFSAKMAAEMDLDYQDAELERKYDDYIENESVEDELDKLKSTLQ